MRLSRLLAALLCVLFLYVTAPLHGQNTGCTERTFIANVFDHGVLPISLMKENFQITYRGQKLAPHFVSYSEGPRRVMVLLDMSGSMKTPQGNAAKWRVAKLAAWDVLTALTPGSKIGLMTFATNVLTRVPLSSNRDAIADWLNGEKAQNVDLLKGRTALYDAIESALDQMRSYEPGDAIFVITDGGENASEVRRSKVQNALRESGVRLFTLMVPTDMYTAPVEFDGRKNLAALSNDSGGIVDPLDTEHGWGMFDDRLKQELRVHITRLSLQISSFYALAVDLPEDPHKTKRWEVTLLEAGKRNRDAWVGYPHEIPPCQAQVAQK
jgi:hypothetical protein